MSAKDLITDPVTGTTSHTKLWSNIAFAAATIIVIGLAWKGNLSTEMFGIYLAVVGVSTTASKYLSRKYSAPGDK